MKGESDKIEIRTTKAFKANTRKLLRLLYDAGLRDNQNMSEYIIEAITEKRDRDTDIIRL